MKILCQHLTAIEMYAKNKRYRSIAKMICFVRSNYLKFKCVKRQRKIIERFKLWMQTQYTNYGISHFNWIIKIHCIEGNSMTEKKGHAFSSHTHTKKTITILQTVNHNSVRNWFKSINWNGLLNRATKIFARTTTNKRK